MRRWLVRICVFLLLGAIVNVAVAWGCAMGHSRLQLAVSTTVVAVTEADRMWLRENVAGSYEEPLTAESRAVAGFAEYRVSEPLVMDGFAAWIQRMLAGWPLKSMTGELGWIDGWSRPREDAVPVRNVWIVDVPEKVRPKEAAEVCFLPLLPIWPGFAINTVFYAFILWLLFAGPFVLRRRRRIRRGLCPKCAYDLRGSTAELCPECGATK